MDPMNVVQPVLGHGTVIARLLASAADGRLSHATLLTGPEGVGKTTAAATLATAVLSAGDWPGGPEAHPDLWLEDGDSENLSIERVRPGGRDGPTLQDFLSLRPYIAERRVAIIGRAERLTEQAANCLLKTIEEPPPGSYLFLCAAHFELLPATILSRCENVLLAPVPSASIRAWLIATHGVDDEVAALAATLSGGRPGRAMRLGTQPHLLATELDSLDTFLAAGGGGVPAALRAAAMVAPGPGADGRERGLANIAAWMAFVRDAACYASGAPELASWAGYRSALELWAEELSPARIVEILQRLASASEALTTYAQPRLTFEALLVEIFGSTNSPPAVPPAERTRALAAARASGAVSAGDTRRRPRPARRARATAAG